MTNFLYKDRLYDSSLIKRLLAGRIVIALWGTWFRNNHMYKRNTRICGAFYVYAPVLQKLTTVFITLMSTGTNTNNFNKILFKHTETRSLDDVSLVRHIYNRKRFHIVGSLEQIPQIIQYLAEAKDSQIPAIFCSNEDTSWNYIVDQYTAITKHPNTT
jgi:hypothetical protein